MKRTENQILFTESLGGLAWFFGGFSLFLAAFFLWLDTLTIGLVLLVAGILLVGFRRKVIVDGGLKEVYHKWGIFISAFGKKPVSIFDAKSVLVYKHLSKTSGRYKSIITDYHIEIELPGGNISIWEAEDDESGDRIATEISDLLNLKYIAGSIKDES
jgi:hypothetical protein